MTDLRQRLLQAFAVEHREHIEAVRAMLGATARGDRGDQPNLVELHRRVHSLKGAARATDLRPIEALSHRLESFIAAIQKGTFALDREAARLVLSGLDAIEDWFAAFAAGDGPPALDDAIARVEGYAAATADGPGEPSGAAVSEHAPITSDPEGRGQLQESLRIDVDSLDRLLRCAGEIMVAGGQVRRIDSDLRRLSREFDSVRRDLDVWRTRLAGHPELEGALAEAGLGAVHEIGERLRDGAARMKGVSDAQRDCSWRATQLGRWLHDEVQHVRLVPADSIFGGLRKMVRDLARDVGKQIDMHVSGADARADRAVLQALKDPLLHILRNAVDHGIETPRRRREAGKPETGSILLDVATRNGRLELRVQDDGRGLDFDRIESVARAGGALSDSDPGIEGIEDAQTYLLQPGFSTAEAVSEISGRGLGLSVVHQAVMRLQGELALSRSDAGGLAVTISVPISVATTRVLLVEAAGLPYAIPSHSVERLHLVDRRDLEFIEERPVLALPDEDDAIAVARLDGLLGVRDENRVDGDGRLTIAVTHAGGNRLALVVDAAVAVRDAVVEDLSEVLPRGPLITGAVLSDDGTVTPLLNPVGLLDRYGERASVDVGLQVGRAAVAPATPVILIVDDSITTRTLEKSILEANGYRVRLSVDGRDALDQLRVEPVDLIVSDIEMPRMDGFGLLRELRRDPTLSGIPVVLVTSRDNEDDRKRGLALGAEAYVVKQRFDQRDLLETIGQLI